MTLASGADPIGSILSANSVIPAVDASLLPTPAQVSFYVKAAKPLPKLPTLTRIQHPLAMRLVAVGRRGKVGWTVLAAVARLESNLGARHGSARRPPAPRRRRRATASRALATFLHEPWRNAQPAHARARAKKALTLYFHGSTRKADRAIALAALYGALGPAGMQKGVRAETARLQRRVLKDKRVHLTIAGRSDIRHGRVDPRVLVTLEYLANSFHKVGISDLVSGGALFSRSGSVSAHLYGRAADVASLHGKVVRGHQGPGTMTEQAIRQLLLLPKFAAPAPGHLADGRRRPHRQPRLVRAARPLRPDPDRLLTDTAPRELALPEGLRRTIRRSPSVFRAARLAAWSCASSRGR